MSIVYIYLLMKKCCCVNQLLLLSMSIRLIFLESSGAFDLNCWTWTVWPFNSCVLTKGRPSVVKVTCSLFRVNFPCKLSFVPTISTILCEWVLNSLTVCLPWLTPWLNLIWLLTDYFPCSKTQLRLFNGMVSNERRIKGERQVLFPLLNFNRSIMSVCLSIEHSNWVSTDGHNRASVSFMIQPSTGREEVSAL